MTKPIIALLYDFDKTLCTTDMEDYAFIPALGIHPRPVLEQGQHLRPGEPHGRPAGVYVHHDGRVPRPEQGALTSGTFWCSAAAAWSCSPACEEWFARINAFGESLGVEVEHYVHLLRPAGDHRGQRHRPRVQADLRQRVLL